VGHDLRDLGVEPCPISVPPWLTSTEPSCTHARGHRPGCNARR
jgi:hypothetical protein